MSIPIGQEKEKIVAKIIMRKSVFVMGPHLLLIVALYSSETVYHLTEMILAHIFVSQ